MGWKLRLLGAIVLSAALLVLALPPADHGWIGWFCLMPLYAAAKGRGFAVGFCAALGTCMAAAFLTTVGWFYPPSDVPGLPTWHFVSFFLFGFPAGMVGGLVGEPGLAKGWRIWVVPAWAVLAEALLQVYLPAHLGLTQYRSAAMLGVAGVTGIWGVSYLVWAANLLPVLTAKPKPAAFAPSIILMAASILIPFASGNGGATVPVAALQSSETDAASLSRDSRRGGLVVWPECGGDDLVTSGDPLPLRQLSAKLPGVAFVTSYADGAEPKPHNTAALFEGGRQSGAYWKQRLFGGERRIRSPGDRPGAADWNGTRVGLSVCFDSCFPSVMRNAARVPGVKLVALPCGGPETPFAVLQAWHGAFTPFRSAEMGVPIVRSDVSGYSQVTDSHGRIVAEAPAGFQGLLTADVVPESRATLYKTLGDWFLWLCIAIVIGGAASTYTKVHSRAKRPKSSVLPV